MVFPLCGLTRSQGWPNRSSNPHNAKSASASTLVLPSWQGETVLVDVRRGRRKVELHPSVFSGSGARRTSWSTGDLEPTLETKETVKLTGWLPRGSEWLCQSETSRRSQGAIPHQTRLLEHQVRADTKLANNPFGELQHSPSMPTLADSPPTTTDGHWPSRTTSSASSCEEPTSHKATRVYMRCFN